MNWKKYLLIAAATFLILFSGFTSFLLIQSNKADADDNQPKNSTTQKESSTSSSGDVQISVTNNIQTVVNGESDATIENKVKNDIEEKDAAIQNNIQNESRDEATITINNAIENLLKGNLQGSVDNNIRNDLLSNGKSELGNNILNDFQLNVNVDISNEVNTTGKKTESAEENNGSKNSSDNEDSNNESSNEDSKNNESNNEETSYLWGIDSASQTTDSFYACVRENFGDPKIVARYLGTNEGVSAGLTSEQVELIHGNEADILPIYNGFTDATGYDNGVNQAKEAISLANDLGVPEGVAIFADIEPTYPVDSAFIQGWYDEMTASNYEPAIYGSFDPDNAITSAFNSAVEEKADISENTYLWSSSPSVGITAESDAPTDYTVDAPDNSLSYGWQYGINSETCNIDTNIFNSNLTEVLWQN